MAPNAFVNCMHLDRTGALKEKAIGRMLELIKMLGRHGNESAGVADPFRRVPRDRGPTNVHGLLLYRCRMSGQYPPMFYLESGNHPPTMMDIGQESDKGRMDIHIITKTARVRPLQFSFPIKKKKRGIP